MINRSFLFHTISFLLLLGTSGVTYGLLSNESERRDEQKETAALLELIRNSPRAK